MLTIPYSRHSWGYQKAWAMGLVVLQMISSFSALNCDTRVAAAVSPSLARRDSITYFSVT
jgi:hypothetical protein